MNIDTGQIYTRDELEKHRKALEKHNIIEVHPEDLTEYEKENKKVDLTGNTKAAGHARYFRNMRKFIHGKQRKI